MNFALENPKALFTAIGGIVVFALKNYIFKDSFSPEIESYLNVILPVVIFMLLGRFTRISKTDASILNEIDKQPGTKKDILIEVERKKNVNEIIND